MGLQLIVKNEDFSAIRVGSLGLSTSISSGLVGLFCLSSVFGVPTKNWAGVTDANIVGSPTVANNGVTSDQNNYIDFNIVSTGNRTMAFVFNNTGVTDTNYFSSFAPAPTYGEYVRNLGSNISFDSSSIGAHNVASAVRDELVAAIVNTGTNRTLYLPRTAASSVVTNAASQNLTTEYRTNLNVSGTASSRAMAFAYWSRALTTAELDTFYNEVKAQLAALGVATI
jgi:hypothetical protein